MKKILLGLSLGLSLMSLAQNSSRFISGKVADYTLGEMPLTAFIYNTQGTFKVGHGNVAEDGIFWLILDKEVSADALEPLLTDVTCDNLPDISTAAINLEFADGLGYLQQASSIEVLEQGLANVGNAKSGGIMYSPQDAMLASNCEFTEGDDVYLVQFDLNLSTGWNKVEGVANPDGQGFHMGNLTESLPWFAFRYE